MRLLLHAPQSSGASVVAMTLAQRDGCLALVDLPYYHLAPALRHERPIVIKAVATTAYALAEHRASFRPDLTLLVLRDPAAVWRSLSANPFRHRNGSAEDKLALFDRLFAAGRDYDGLLHYEDLVARPERFRADCAAHGWPLPERAPTLPRGIETLAGDFHAAFPELQGRLDLSFGAFRGDAVSAGRRAPVEPAQRARAEALCPALAAHYRERRPSPAEVAADA